MFSRITWVCVVETSVESASPHRYVDVSALIYTYIYTKTCIHIQFMLQLIFTGKEIIYTVIKENKY